MRARRPAFTVIELVVVVGMIGVGLAILPGPLNRSREAANKIKCASNLRQIALAGKMYSNNERNNGLARARHDIETPDKPTAYTKPNAPNPFAEDGPDANDVTAALFLLLRTQEIVPEVFVCPSSTAERFAIDAGKNVQFYSNFSSQRHLSYGLSNPYYSAATIDRGVKWDETMSADFALMADMGPGGDAVMTVKFNDPGSKQRQANSRNHGRDGQNVMFADAHVEWCASVWAGAQQDNVFTFRKEPGGRPAEGEPGGVAGSPVDDTDTVILPTFDEKVGMPGGND